MKNILDFTNMKTLILLMGLLVSIPIFSKNYSQSVYKTYSIENQNHEILLMKDSLVVKMDSPHYGLGQGTNYIFLYQKQGDTLFLSSMIKNKIRGVNIQSAEKEFVNQFENAKIKYISDCELLLVGENRPYYRQECIDEKFKNNIHKNPLVVTILDGVITKESKNIEDKEFLEKLKKYKHTLVFIQGKEAVKQYGIEGLYGVIEIKGILKKKYKKKQQKQ